ncbi:hypothetical protein HID58_036004 [Brassica napus]|uniref:PRA1 family protein n=1 Tax=Brassica napus TaxID=3708 RepID=A0ABQ8C7Y6_BRANA|nr:hypothetical protein HID58_036004 [Brassica napus]
MSTPPLLPVTNQQAVQSQPPINTPAFHTFFSRLSTSIRDGLSQRRPLAELVDRSSMARPESLTDALSRIRKNLAYFKIMHVIEPLVGMIGCYMLILVESFSRWFSSTAPELSSTVRELSSTATELSSMAIKLYVGGDGALSQ